MAVYNEMENGQAALDIVVIPIWEGHAALSRPPAHSLLQGMTARSCAALPITAGALTNCSPKDMAIGDVMARTCCFNIGPQMSIVPSPPQAGARIAASVGLAGGNRPDDTRLIQDLLNRVRAVSPPLAVDGLVGPKTIAAIRLFQNAQFGSADGRVDPHGRTLARLNVLVAPQGESSFRTGSPRLGLVAAAATPAAAPPLTPLQAAVEATPRAILWVSAAIAHLRALNVAIMAAGGDMRLVLPFVMSTVNTHFHLDRDPSGILVNINAISGVFGRILQMLGDPARFYTEGAATEKSPFADATMGGFFMKDVKMTFRTQYPGCGPNVRTAMLVHEGAHFCGKLNEINHFAMEFPAPDGRPQDGSTRNYAQLTTSEAMRNASSYAAFAIHAFFNADLRFGAGDLTK